ncbi:DUF4186 family protein [Kribbella sp. VKM Ac-2566]|uniref:DUF4186 family protein n=1 Tax=Kribbella sp. VKM Ac-2566 TaxID=2512218 RepID=UPI0010CFCB46|nr:DUF4186 family protein [Kribbella sp. VKM Ac-2566]TDX04024.1 uncharacterized protein DUF4186 [Kribbella sp. VKM Ac-2566]
MSRHDFAPDLLKRLREQIEAKQTELAKAPADAGLVPLKIACTMTSCRNGRHCLDFMRRPHKDSAAVAPGSCRDCGAPVITMPDSGDQQYGSPEQLLQTCMDQQHELIRAHYWNVPIDRWAYNQALRLGRIELQRRIEQRVIDALTSTDIWAGRAAAYSKNIVAYAQHATATCCRSCAAYWHGLPRDRSIQPSAAQLEHAVWAAQAWLAIRLPDLPTHGQSIGAIPRTSLLSSAEASAIDDVVMERLADGVDPAGLVVPDDSHLEVTAIRSGLVIARTIDIKNGH